MNCSSGSIYSGASPGGRSGDRGNRYDQEEEAEALYDQAMAMLDSGLYSQALEKFEESLVHTSENPSTRYRLELVFRRIENLKSSLNVSSPALSKSRGRSSHRLKQVNATNPMPVKEQNSVLIHGERNRYVPQTAFNEQTMNLKPAWKSIASAFIATILIISLLLSTFTFGVDSRIDIDGNFQDWEMNPMFQDEEDSSNPCIDIIRYSMTTDDEFVSFFIQTRSSILRGDEGLMDTIYIFIENDKESDTGYSMNGLGADALLRVEGTGNEVITSQLLFFDREKATNDWQGWSYATTIEASARGTSLELQVNKEKIQADGFEALVMITDSNRSMDTTEIIDNDGYLSVTVLPACGSNPNQVKFSPVKILLEAKHCDIIVRELKLKIIGDAPVLFAFLTPTENEKSYLGNINDSYITFSTDMKLKKDHMIVFSVNMTIQHSHNTTIGLMIEDREDIRTDKGAVNVHQ